MVPHRKADIDPKLRATFERYGKGGMQLMLADANSFMHEGKATKGYAPEVLPQLLDWLTEEYDKKEQWETWSLTMEIAITLFVLCELAIDAGRILGLWRA